jgi:hypothetical protein
VIIWCQPLVLGFQLGQFLFEREKIVIRSQSWHLPRSGKASRISTASALKASLSPRIFNQNAPQRLGGGRKKMATTIELLLDDQAQV